MSTGSQLAAPVVPQLAGRRHFTGTRGLALNGGALILNVFASGLTGLLFWILAARVADPAVVAKASTTITAVIAVVSLTQQSFVLTLPALLAVSPEPRRLALRTYAVALGITAVAAPAYVLVGPSLAGGLDFLRDWHLAAGFVLGTLVWCIFSLQDAVLTGVRRAKVVLLENTTWGVARLAVVLGTWFVGIELGVGWVVASWVVPALVLVCAVSWYLFLNPTSPLVAGLDTRSFGRRRFLSFMGAEYVGSVLGSGVQLVAGAYALTTLGARAAAPLLTAASLVLVVEGALGSFSQALAVEASGSGGDDQRRRNLLRLTIVLLGGVSVLAVAAAAVAGEQVMALLGSHYRESGGTALAILMLCVPPRSVILVSNADNRLRGQGGRNLLQQVVGATFFFGLLLTGRIDTVAEIAWALVGMRVAAAIPALFQLRQGRLRLTSA